MKWILAVGVLAAVIAVPVAGSATQAKKAALSTYDKYWLKSSIEGDIFEIKSGNIAKQKAGTDAVKTLALTLIKDHTKSLADATKLAHKLGVTVPKAPSPVQQWILQQFQNMGGGAGFDQAWSKEEVNDHIQDIDDTSLEVNGGTNLRVRSDARKDLPVLKKHLSMARTALKSAGGTR